MLNINNNIKQKIKVFLTNTMGHMYGLFVSYPNLKQHSLLFKFKVSKTYWRIIQKFVISFNRIILFKMQALKGYDIEAEEIHLTNDAMSITNSEDEGNIQMTAFTVLFA